MVLKQIWLHNMHALLKNHRIKTESNYRSRHLQNIIRRQRTNFNESSIGSHHQRFYWWGRCSSPSGHANGGDLATFPPYWRDVLSKTELIDYFWNIGFALVAFDLVFTLQRRWSIWMLFEAYQFPWPFCLCVSGSALVMTIDSVGKVTCGSHIVTTIKLALNYVNMIMHKKAYQMSGRLSISSGGSDETRTRDLPALLAGRSKQDWTHWLFLKYRICACGFWSRFHASTQMIDLDALRSIPVSMAVLSLCIWIGLGYDDWFCWQGHLWIPHSNYHQVGFELCKHDNA